MHPHPAPPGRSPLAKSRTLPVQRFMDPMRQHDEVMADMEALLASERKGQRRKIGKVRSQHEEVMGDMETLLTLERKNGPCLTKVIPKKPVHQKIDKFSHAKRAILAANDARLRATDLAWEEVSHATPTDEAGSYSEIVIGGDTPLRCPLPDVEKVNNVYYYNLYDSNLGAVELAEPTKNRLSENTEVDKKAPCELTAANAESSPHVTSTDEAVAYPETEGPVPERIATAAKESDSPLPCPQPEADAKQVDDRLRDASLECLAALRHAVGLFSVFEADLKAGPKRELSSFPALQEFSRDAERLLAAVDRVVPKSYSGGAGSRLEFSAAVAVDPGQPSYFTSTPELPSLSDAVRRVAYDNYFICPVEGCGKGVAEWNRTKHVEDNHGGTTSVGTWIPMDAAWVISNAERFPEPLQPIFMYCLETPLCYDGNRSMRQVRGQGRDPFENTKVDERMFVETHWPFQTHLRNSLNTLPDVEAITYRAVNFNVPSSMYRQGMILTWNQASSTSADPRVVKDFLGGSSGEVRGTIFIIHVKHGKRISEYSQYPEENEVLLMANTQLRVMPAVGTGTKELIACALRCDLSHVAIVELMEVTDTFNWSGDFPSALFPEERITIASVLKSIAQLPGAETWMNNDCYQGPDNPVTGAGVFVCEAPMSQCPYPNLLSDLLAVTQSFEVWTVVLHRLAESAVREWVDFVPMVLKNCAPSAEVLKSLGEDGYYYLANPYAHYAAAPAFIGVLEAVTLRYGFDFVFDLLEVNPFVTFGDVTFAVMLFAHATEADIKTVVARAVVRDPVATSVSTAIRFLAGPLGHSRLSAVLPVIVAMGVTLDDADSNALTAAHIACDYGDAEGLEALVTAGADMGCANYKGETVLLLAAKKGIGLKAIASVTPSMAEMCDREGKSPLHWACMNNHLEVVKLLVSLAPSMAVVYDDEGVSPLSRACHEGRLEVVKVLLSLLPSMAEVCDNESRSLLWAAACAGRFEVAEFLLSLTPSMVEVCDKSGASPLHAACAIGHLETVKILVSRAPWMAQVCDKGVNHPKGYEMLPVDMARVRGHAHVVAFLEVCSKV